MNNKKIPALIIVVLLILGGGAFALKKSTDNKNARETATADSVAMEKKESSDGMMEQQAMAKSESESMEKSSNDSTAMSAQGKYVTLADYQKDTANYADYTKVYFFHATWCPDCKAIETEITSDPTKVPNKVVFIKTDFDSQTELRRKYGVTIQHTFIQVDSSDNSIKKWTATNLDQVIAGIII